MRLRDIRELIRLFPRLGHVQNCKRYRSSTGGDLGNSSPHAVADSELAALRAELVRRGHEIDALQVQASEKAVPWYRSVSAMVPALALVASLLTFGLSYQWSLDQSTLADDRLRQENIHDAHAELSANIQHLFNIRVEAARLNPEDPVDAGLFAFYKAEQAMLTSQSLDIALSLPGVVTSTEYRSVGFFLSEELRMEEATRMYELSIEAAESPAEYVVGLGELGNFLMYLGDIDGGRQRYQQALALQQGPMPLEQESLAPLYYLDTEINWAQSELNFGECSEVGGHLEAAERHLDSLNPGFRTLLATRYQYRIHQIISNSVGCGD